MNLRQRRGMLLVLLAAVGAGLVLLLTYRYVSDVRSQLGPTVQVLELQGDVEPFRELTDDDVQVREVPQRFAPANRVQDPAQLRGLVAATALPGGTVLQTGMLEPRAAIEPGQREIAILVDAETAVAGKVVPGDVVDVFATFPATDDVPATARIVIQQARIVEVGVPTTRAETETGAFGADNAVVPVTFALSVSDSRTLAYVESFATSIRLALRAPTDTVVLEDGETVYAPRFGAEAPSRFEQAAAERPAEEPPAEEEPDTEDEEPRDDQEVRE